MNLFFNSLKFVHLKLVLFNNFKELLLHVKHVIYRFFVSPLRITFNSEGKKSTDNNKKKNHLLSVIDLSL